MVQRNKLLSVTHQNRNRKWMGIAARVLGVTQWETRGEKEQKSFLMMGMGTDFFLKKGYGRCGGVIQRNVHWEQS